jgi:membrane associated rhomboid family serine protease
VPANLWRDNGLSLITSFFLHAGIVHLLGNLYFLNVFGDNVEDYLGKKRFLFLLIAATVIGGLCHAYIDRASLIPAVGASGGISGLIIFYALLFPNRELGFVWVTGFTRPIWHKFSALTALIVWIIWQYLGFITQIQGQATVSFAAHLGGAATGFLFWLAWKKIV